MKAEFSWKMLYITMIIGIGCWALIFLGIQKAYAQQYYGGDTRYIYLNDSSCPEGYRENVLRPALDMWSFYGKPELFGLKEESIDTGVEQNFRDNVSCETHGNMTDIWGSLAAITQTWSFSGTFEIVEADIVVRMDYARSNNDGSCTALHELGHSLGLAKGKGNDDPISIFNDKWLHGHPKDSKSAMYHQIRCYQNFLTVTDLLLIAESYDAPANCTPYIQKDYSVYFPNVKGFEAELRYKNGGWDIAWFNPSRGDNWDCDLITTKDSIQGSFYQDGNVWQKTLYFNKGRFTE